ncbi:hypothetical protein [Methanobrevibacter sp.]|uniref:hypothetical protein n=1 Tax=Methanobrevibacter sp. TaxID=66852 RepID=UPI0025DC299C|nr:hypothetical protein [Methanobrevibacter sp.]MBQ2832896.1 hypothetical protein [Methanobrevibacter sp.]
MVNEDFKRFHHEPYMNPNNYDLYFNPEEVPSNIRVENGRNLEKRLNKLISPTQFVHLNIDSATLPADNNVVLYGEMLVNGKKVSFI